MEFMNSPFVVPVAGCLVGIVAIISGIWLDAQKRRLKSEERVAMISRGVPIAEIEKIDWGRGGEASGQGSASKSGQCAANRDCSGIGGIGTYALLCHAELYPAGTRCVVRCGGGHYSVGHRDRLLHRLQPAEARAVALRVGGWRRIGGELAGCDSGVSPGFCTPSADHAHWLHCFLGSLR